MFCTSSRLMLEVKEDRVTLGAIESTPEQTTKK